MKRHTDSSFALGLILAFLVTTGCARKDSPPATAAAPEGHAHVAQQGGVLAEVGEEAYHIEFRHGETAGVVQAFIMDGEAENFVRSDQPAFTARARSGDLEIPLTFRAVASSATGEKVGDTSLFEASTSLPPGSALTITVPVFTLKGHDYHDITVELPAAKP